MDIQKDKLTIQQVTKATGLSAHTLRYYERRGLVPGWLQLSRC